MKQIIITLLLLSIDVSAQNAKFPKVNIDVPCTGEFVDNYAGKWLVPAITLDNAPGKDFSQGATTRLREIQKLILEAYPQPKGADGYWSGGYSKTYFAERITFVKEDDGSRMESVSKTTVNGLRYSLVLLPWYCDDKNKNQIWNGYPDVGDGDGMKIVANDVESIVNGSVADDDTMTINGEVIKYKMPVIGTWKGYEVMCGVAAQLASDRHVLISRNGLLPYIPVTRKQYLDRAVAYVTKIYDEWIAGTDKVPDKESAADARKSLLNLKKEALQKYKDALDESIKRNILDAPAIVLFGPMGESQGPIFSTEAEGGRMLVTDNPNYYRKDLPGYVPQLFAIEWTWGKLKLAGDFRRAIEENFPIEKLQDMIDK